MNDQQAIALSCFQEDTLAPDARAIYDGGDNGETVYVLDRLHSAVNIFVPRQVSLKENSVEVPLMPIEDVEDAAWTFLFRVAVAQVYNPPRWQFESRWRIVEKMGIQLLVSDAEYMAVHPHRGNLHGFLIYKPSGVVLLDPISAFGSPDAFAKGFFDRDPEVLKAAKEHTEGNDRRLPEVLNTMWAKNMFGARTKWVTHVRKWHRYPNV